MIVGPSPPPDRFGVVERDLVARRHRRRIEVHERRAERLGAAAHEHAVGVARHEASPGRRRRRRPRPAPSTSTWSTRRSRRTTSATAPGSGDSSSCQPPFFGLQAHARFTLAGERHAHRRAVANLERRTPPPHPRASPRARAQPSIPSSWPGALSILSATCGASDVDSLRCDRLYSFQTVVEPLAGKPSDPMHRVVRPITRSAATCRIPERAATR